MITAETARKNATKATENSLVTELAVLAAAIERASLRGRFSLSRTYATAKQGAEVYALAKATFEPPPRKFVVTANTERTTITIRWDGFDDTKGQR